MKGGFIKIPFIGGNNNQQVLINAMCNQLDEHELDKHPRKIDAFVKSLCPNSSYNQNSIGGASNSSSGGIFGMVKNLGSMATSPIRGLLNSLSGNQQQQLQQQQILNNQLLMNNQALNNQQVLNNQPVLNNQVNTQANTKEKSQSNSQINNNIESPKKTQSAGSLKKKIKLPKL